MGTPEYIGLMAGIMLLTDLAIDIMLPTFEAVRQHFKLGETSTATAQIVTFFFVGQLGQLAFGFFTDRFGRLPVLRVGFLLYIAGCLSAGLAASFAGLLVARFVTGLGASALFVSAIACVRDRFSGEAMARTMSLILTIFLMVPVIAPLLGTWILANAGWQMVFLSPALFALLFWGWSWRLEESRPIGTQALSSLSSLIVLIGQVCRNRIFFRYTALTTILFAGFSSFIGSSERLVGKIYQRPNLFVFIFASVGLTMALFTFLNAQLVSRFGMRRTVRALSLTYWLVAGVLLGLTVSSQGLLPMSLFFGLVALLQGINVAIEPNSSSLALQPMNQTAGLAASIYGTSYLVVGALAGSIIDRLLTGSVTALSITYFVGGLVALLLARTDPYPSK